MRKILLFSAALLLVISCGVKTTQALLNDGDYDGAIGNSLESLKYNKTSKGKQDYVYLLEEAFAKAKERDLRTLDLLTKESNPANLEKIYNLYLQLNDRQERIRPILPLYLMKERRNAIFPFDDYTQGLVDSKNKLAKYLYENSKALLHTQDKMNCRRSYDDFMYLDKLYPNYKDVRKLMEEAHFKGTDFVHVYTKNDTQMVIPARLEHDLLDFSTLGLNSTWTVYHTSKQKDLKYDFALLINFRQINLSPEQIKEKEYVKERQIKNGSKPLLDAKGNQMKDDKGVPIKVDNFETVRASIYEFKQLKSCQINAKVDYLDIKTNQLLNSFPIASEFVFENTYANCKGDRRAADDNYMPYFDRRPMPFPTNEQMVFDTGEDLKSKLKSVITNNRFRN